MRIFKSNSRGSVSQRIGATPEAESADVLAGDHVDSESSEAYQAAFLDYMNTLMGETNTEATNDSTVLVSAIKTDPASPRHHSEQPERLFTIRTQSPPDSPIASAISPLPSPSPLAVLKPKKFGLIRTCAKAASKLTVRRNKQIAPQPLGQPLGEGVESHVLDNDSIVNTRETDSSVNTQAQYLKDDIFASRDGAEGSDTDPSGSSGANRGPSLANGTMGLDKREEDLDR